MIAMDKRIIANFNRLVIKVRLYRRTNNKRIKSELVARRQAIANLMTTAEYKVKGCCMAT